jgi:N-acetylglucosaminyldiphosphoundecaprenol N-acetyl-beta-D-mannosaminyltransferase
MVGGLGGPTQAADDHFRRILGVRFFGGRAVDAIGQMRGGGLLVVPAAPALVGLVDDPGYREAITNADLCITDSGFMVLVWNWIKNDSIYRLSGLEYLQHLLRESDVRLPGNTVWVMPSAGSAELNVAWLHSQGIDVPTENVYLAPKYGSEIEDLTLLDMLTRLRPQHVIVAVGGGTQERLGLYLKRHLDYLPEIHCIGAAIGFLSGDQVHIPAWADRQYMGWLFRCWSDPAKFVPRYGRGLRLGQLLLRYGSELPPFKGE